MSADDGMVRSSLENVLDKYSPDADVSGIDEIVISYIFGVVEEVAADDDFDSEGMKDFMTAYIPDFEVVPDEAVSTWVFDMVKKLNDEKNKGKSNNGVTLDTVLSSFTVETRKHSTSHSVSESSERSQKISETSTGSEEESCPMDGYSEGLSMLLEMFPASCNLELQHCLATSTGDLEQATTLLLQRQEAGTSIKTINSSKAVGAKGNKKIVADKDLRNSILNRYGFVDNDEDAIEHRPVAPKWESKKLVRYLDNKVVSLKGERYTELKKEETDEMKKTYVNLKPGKQYRFH